MSPTAWSALKQVCDLAAMPTWLEFEEGVLDEKLKAAGYIDVQTENVTQRMLPMLQAFNLLGSFPYWIGRKINRVEKTVNAMSGVEMWRHRGTWSYNITTASKPA